MQTRSTAATARQKGPSYRVILDPELYPHLVRRILRLVRRLKGSYLLLLDENGRQHTINAHHLAEVDPADVPVPFKLTAKAIAATGGADA